MENVENTFSKPLYFQNFLKGVGCPQTPQQTRASVARFQAPPAENTLHRPCDTIIEFKTVMTINCEV